ncbi:outer membrane lipoprotein carrier protein LolA [Myroides sp. M-43]|uniref:LolA family protein n=1 Tax=Myroides oncorhynchi TaxID=2893756 RepID=UPI001E4224E0|nr:outer membrane lipoprotein carrier protein LolA [Myroides oncorhynchi]MCC9041226.1 outer membrane lipoprotein carrier protein LolA [Myroides oncorhynchi]
MKKIIAFIGVALFAIAANAQSSQRAKNYLTEVTNKINGYDNISINFSFTQKNDKNTKQDFEGKGTLDIKKDLYNLSFMGIQKIYDGKKIYTISKEDEEVTVSKFDSKSPDGILPSQMLTFFNQGYSFQWDILQNVNGRKIQYIKLIPTDKKSVIKEVFLGIDSSSKEIYNKIQVNKDGGKSTLTVNSFKTNQTMSKNHFTFTQSLYPNYYINNID